MATKGNRETIRKRNKLIARIFYGAIAILIIWGFIAFITSSPVNEDLMTQRPQGSSTEGSVELPDKPSREKLRFPPFEVMPEGAIAGVLFNAEANFHDVLEKRKLYGILSLLFPSADLEALLAKVDNDLVVCLYESKEQELILKGAITCADEQTAIEQHDKLMELINEDGKLQLGDMALPFQRDGRDISIALIADELPLLPRSTRKPIARLSTAREVQALAGHDEPISVFADLSRLKDFLNRKFPSVNGEASVQTAFNALDLNGVTSAAMTFSAEADGANTGIYLKGVRGEGFFGMVSTYDTEVNCQRFYPATTLFFASQTFDIGRLLKSVGGLFATTVPRKKQRLGEEISNSLTSVGISTGVLARALTDTISVGIAFDTILPEVWATAEIADQDVLESIIAVMEAEETVVRKKRNERDVFFATAPLLELQAGQLKYKVLPAFTIVDGNLVIASSSTSLYRTLSIIAGKEKSLGDDEQFKTALEQAGSNSSFVFARTAMISRKISTLLGSDSGALSFLDEFGEVFWSSATRDLTFLSIKQRTDVPIPVANHLLRPTMLPMTMAALPHYDRFLTMAISSVNWAGSKLYYYDYEHLDIGIDATGEQIAIDAKARVRSLVEDSTGFTFAINPFYEIESVTLDGKKAKWKLTGPFLAVSAPERLAKESVHEVRVVARGMPENLTNLVPPALLKAFRVYSRPVRTDDGLHLSLTSLFYPSPPGLRQDHWTSRTRVTVKKGWEAIANGNLMSVEETGNGVMYTFLDDRPDMLLEVIAGEFERVMDKNANFTVVHYFQPGAIEDKPGMLNFAAECYSYYIDKFGGDFDKMPTIVHMKEQPGISHCNSYIVSYTRRMTTMAHELSHLWWGGLVKVDPLRSSMWYEGMAEYSTLMFIGHKYGQKDYNDYKTYQFNRWHRYDFPPRHYRDIRYWSPGRGIVGYVKGMAYFSGLHGLMGDDKFEEFLKELTSEPFRYADAGTLWEASAKVDDSVSWYNRAMLAGKGYFDLEITSLEKVNEGRYLIKVRSRGFYYWRAEIAVAGLTTDNKPFATTFRMGKGDTRVEIELNVEGDIMMVTLDPHELIPELKRTNNTYKVE